MEGTSITSKKAGQNRLSLPMVLILIGVIMATVALVEIIYMQFVYNNYLDNLPKDVGFILSLCGIFFIPFILLGISLLFMQLTVTTTPESRGWRLLLIFGAFVLLVGSLIISVYSWLAVYTDLNVMEDFDTVILFSRWASVLNAIGYLVVVFSTLFLIRAYLRGDIRFRPREQT